MARDFDGFSDSSRFAVWQSSHTSLATKRKLAATGFYGDRVVRPSFPFLLALAIFGFPLIKLLEIGQVN